MGVPVTRVIHAKSMLHLGTDLSSSIHHRSGYIKYREKKITWKVVNGEISAVDRACSGVHRTVHVQILTTYQKCHL